MSVHQVTGDRHRVDGLGELAGLVEHELAVDGGSESAKANTPATAAGRGDEPDRHRDLDPTRTHQHGPRLRVRAGAAASARDPRRSPTPRMVGPLRRPRPVARSRPGGWS